MESEHHSVLRSATTRAARRAPRAAATLGACLVGAACLVLSPGSGWAQERATLTLEEARVLLIERSTDLIVQDYTIEQASLLEDTARAVLLPALNLNATYTFRDREIEFEQGNVYAPLAPYLESVFQSDPALQDFFANNPDFPDARALAAAETSPIIVQYRHDYRIVATLTQTIFNAQAFPLLDQAETSYLQAQNGREQVMYQLQAGLQALYFRAVALQRLIVITERTLELENIAYQRALAAFEEEVGNRFEVNRAEVRVRRAELELENARREYEVALEELALFVNADAPFDVVEPPPLERPAVAEIDSLTVEALETRPELRGQELAIRFAEERIRETRSTWAPTLIATADATVTRESAFSGDAFSWTLGLMLNWDIWDGGLRLAERDRRELTLLQEQAVEDQLVRNVRSELRQTMIQLESQIGQVETAQAEAELATRNVQLTEMANELGTATLLEVETARTQAFLAELNLARSEITLRSLVYEIYRLAGRFQPNDD